MTFKRFFIMLIFAVLLSFSVNADEMPDIKGLYTKLPGHQFKFDGKKVEIIEFLSFYCGHCYEFEKSIPIIKGNFPKKIEWKTIPTYWGKGSTKPGEAYFLAVEEGKGEQMKKALFDAFFIEKRDIGNVGVLEDIGMKIGLGFDFSRRLRAGDKAKDVGEAIIQANKYKIEETPSLIIAGNLKASLHDVGHGVDAFRNNTITILKSIFKNK
jgi:thiol:disulfide interchange protein DsbA